MTPTELLIAMLLQEAMNVKADIEFDQNAIKAGYDEAIHDLNDSFRTMAAINEVLLYLGTDGIFSVTLTEV